MNIRLGWDSSLRIFPVLDAVLGISNTREEGEWPQGKIIFTEPRMFSDIEFIIRFNHDNLIIIVVSADRPVSVIQEGLELNAQCEWKPVSRRAVLPPPLEEWLSGA